MRVLQLIPTLVVGGAERMVGRLASHLQRWGHTVSVVSMYDPFDTWIEAELRSEGVGLHFLGKRPGVDARMIPRIACAIARFRPDVLHTHMYTLKYALPAIAWWGSRFSIVHTIHSVANHEADRLSRAIQYFAFRFRVVPVAIGEGVAASMRSVYGMLPYHIIPNGIPLSVYVPPPTARGELRRCLNIPPCAPTFVAVAQLNRLKNHEMLIAAFASKRLESLGAHLLLAGDGERRTALEHQAHALRVADRVHFLGVRSDVPRVLAAADAFVLASRYEGNPLSVMEAMAAGKPVVATAVGCVPELVTESTGRLVPPGDSVALERAMYELASDLSVAGSMGEAAAQVARERFDDAQMARAYERLYTLETLSRSPGKCANGEYQ